MVNIVKLRLSGSSDRLYTYLWDHLMTDAYLEPGMRAVVPSKLKEDGTLSLAIGTIVEVERGLDESVLDPTVAYKWVVQFLNPAFVDAALERAKAEEAAAPSTSQQLATTIEQARKKHGV